MHIRKILSALLVCASTFLPAVVQAEAPADSSTAAKPDVTADMERLASISMKNALKAVATKGALYPFALIMDDKHKISVISYSGELDKMPPAEEYAANLLTLVRETLKANNTPMVATIAREIFVPDDKGKKNPGIWVLTDHRYGTPQVVFLPLVLQKDGKTRKPGKQIVQASQQSLFPKAATTESETNDTGKGNQPRSDQ